jgi:6-phosphogluconolactonase
MREAITTFDDPRALTEAAARHWRDTAAEAIASRGAFHVALSGGSTPRALYQRLAQPDHARLIDWQSVHIYFGDERAVAPDHADSNFRMAQEALFSHVPIPLAQIYRMPADEQPIVEAAAEYESVLCRHLPKSERGVPQFDLVLLGLGPDGHTASLFPGTPILHERERLVGAVYVDTLDSWRLSLTLPVIDAARQIMVLVVGENKAAIMSELFGHGADRSYPIQLIEPLGDMCWYVDAAAARALERN